MLVRPSIHRSHAEPEQIKTLSKFGGLLMSGVDTKLCTKDDDVEGAIMMIRVVQMMDTLSAQSI